MELCCTLPKEDRELRMVNCDKMPNLVEFPCDSHGSPLNACLAATDQDHTSLNPFDYKAVQQEETMTLSIEMLSRESLPISR